MSLTPSTQTRTTPTPTEMALSYADTCKYYELCVPGLETKNPHFKSCFHIFKRESSPTVESVNNVNVNTQPSQGRTTSSSQQQQQHTEQEKTTITGGGSNLKLLVKGKKDNKVQVKCSCSDITDGSAIKRKFFVKCNKCQAMVHGKCHNLNAQLFNNSNNNLSNSWYCSACTVVIQNDMRKNAMAEDIKRAMKLSPPSSSTISHNNSKTSSGKATEHKKNSANKEDHKDQLTIQQNSIKVRSKNRNNSSSKSKHKEYKTKESNTGKLKPLLKLTYFKGSQL